MVDHETSVWLFSRDVVEPKHIFSYISLCGPHLIDDPSHDSKGIRDGAFSLKE